MVCNHDRLPQRVVKPVFARTGELRPLQTSVQPQRRVFLFSQIPTIALDDGSGPMDGATAAGMDQRLLHAQGCAFAAALGRAAPGARAEVPADPPLYRVRAASERSGTGGVPGTGTAGLRAGAD